MAQQSEAGEKAAATAATEPLETEAPPPEPSTSGPSTSGPSTAGPETSRRPADQADSDGSSALGADASEPSEVTEPSAEKPAGTDSDETDFGEPGKPINRQGPFYIGFVGAIGVLLAWNLLKLIASLSSVLTLVGVAAFLAIGLDPLVRALQRRGLSRGSAVAMVFAGVLLVF